VTEIFLDVSERFYSLQGESTRAGLPCFFIRLAGCNLRCSYCDSRYTWEKPGTKTSLKDILAWTDEYPESLVELTGGEPLLQPGSFSLLDELVRRNRTVLVETNGTVEIENVPEKAVVILDIKCPGSGMDSSTCWDNIKIINERCRRGSRDEIKFVLTSVEDFHWAKEVTEKFHLDRIAAILFSPVEEVFPPRDLAELILQHRLRVRLQLQLHRILWPELKRGG